MNLKENTLKKRKRNMAIGMLIFMIILFVLSILFVSNKPY